MPTPTRQRSRLSKTLLGGVLWGFLLVGCASQNTGLVSPSVAPLESEIAQNDRAVDGVAPEAKSQPSAQSVDQAVMEGAGSTTALAATAVSAAPQLAKTAELEVSVEDAPLSIQTAQQIVRQNQGDLLQLQDTAGNSHRHSSPHRSFRFRNCTDEVGSWREIWRRGRLQIGRAHV